MQQEPMRTMKTTGRLSLLAIALSATIAAFPAAAETYPSRFIKFVVPFPAGGTSEILARMLASKMGDSMGQSIVIENIAGATGAIGASNVARAAPDGYTLLFGYSPQFTTAPVLSSSLSYDPIKSFQPIGTVAQFRLLFTAYSKLPFNTMSELASYAKAHPGKLSYGSPGNGTSGNMILEQFKLRQGIDIVHIPYRGGGPAIVDLIAGRVDVYADAVGALLPRVQEGTIKALAVSSAQRQPYLPNVPSVVELGMPELNVATWTALFAPAGTPPEITKVLESELSKALQDAELRKAFAQHYYETIPASPAQVTERIETEIAKWRAVVQATGMKSQ
jgi:tripartite-type tricarboxylate transporter receptor subunit TctC